MRENKGWQVLVCLFVLLIWSQFSESLTNCMKILSKYCWLPPSIHRSTDYNLSGYYSQLKNIIVLTHHQGLPMLYTMATWGQTRTDKSCQISSTARLGNSYCNISLIMIIIIVIIAIAIVVAIILIAIIVAPQVMARRGQTRADGSCKLSASARLSYSN